MFDPSEWFEDCERSLADAEYLANRLARFTVEPDSDLTALRLGISALRAEFERARIELGYGVRKVRDGHPLAGPGSPWCEPAEATDL